MVRACNSPNISTDKATAIVLPRSESTAIDPVRQPVNLALEKSLSRGLNAIVHKRYVISEFGCMLM